MATPCGAAALGAVEAPDSGRGVSAATRVAASCEATRPPTAVVGVRVTVCRCVCAVMVMIMVRVCRYITADYTDHPTAHLVEGLFVKHDRDLFRVAAYSYGRGMQGLPVPSLFVCSRALSPDDESAFRQRIVGLADAFSDMVTFTFKEIAEAIRQDACHILLDMQVHTRSTWCEGC